MAEVGSFRSSGFAAEDYEVLIREMLARGYQSVSLDALDPNKPHMFIRHDVDLCMERAAQIARRESQLGVTSTFYFLLSTRFYNLASARGRAILKEMLALGHSLGLHFDTTQYQGTIEQIEVHAAEECEILERLAGAQVRSLSFHRPAPELLNREGAYAGRRHTYEPAFFQSIAYVSDSNGGWHHGHPLDHAAVASGRAIQLLTHPIWWCSTEPRETVEAVECFRSERIDDLTADLKGTIKAYRNSTDCGATGLSRTSR